MELLKSSSGPFELDPCFEFDAPKFCDLSKIRDDAEDCHQHVDSWFDAKGGNGLCSPIKIAAPVSAARVDLAHNSAWQSASKAAETRDYYQAGTDTGMEEMDIDSPEPSRPIEPRRPVTRSQTKAASTRSAVFQSMDTDSPLLQPFQESTGRVTRSHIKSKTPVSRAALQPVSSVPQSRQQGCDFSAMKQSSSSVKRVLQPILQVPVRSTKPLTEPMDFELRTSKRHRPTPPQAPSQQKVPSEEFVPLVERTRLFHQGANERFANNPSGKPKLDTRAPPPLTNPKTPHLRCKTRAAARPACSSAQDATQPFGANVKPPPKGTERPAVPGASKKPAVTKPEPFKFATELRSGSAPQGQAGNIRDPHGKAAPNTAAFVFSAEGGTKAAATGKGHPTVTKPQPFNFNTDKRAVAHSHPNASDQPPVQFRARAIPVSNEVKSIPAKQPSRSLTVPESPGLRSTRRHASFLEQQRQKQEKEERERREAASFKARGMLVTQPFVPQPSRQALTVPHQPHMVLEQRAADRSMFDRAQAERERIAEMERQAALAAKNEHEAEEIRKLRKTMVPKARPMPDFAHPFCPVQSDLPLTEAITPKLGVRTRRIHQ